jgi:hypothetical protein
MVKRKALGSTLLSFVLLLLAAAGVAYLSYFSNYIPEGSATLNGQQFEYGLSATFGYFINVWRPSQFPHALAFVGLVMLLVAVFSFLILFILALVKKKAFLILPSFLFAVDLAALVFVLILVVPMVEMGVLGVIANLGSAVAIGVLLFALIFAVAPITPLIKSFTYSIKMMAGAKKPRPTFELEPGLDVETARELIRAELSSRLVVVSAEQPVESEKEEIAPIVEKQPEVAETPIAEKVAPVEVVEKPSEEKQVEPVKEQPAPIVIPEENSPVEDDLKTCDCPMKEKGLKHGTYRSLKALLATLISAIFLAGAVGITLYLGYFTTYIPAGTGMLNGAPFNYGFDASIGYLINVWRPSAFPHALSFISLILLLIAIVVMLTLIIMAVVKLKFVLILPTLLLGGSIAGLVFILILVIPMVQLGVLRVIPTAGMAGAFGLTLFALYFAYAPISPLLKCIFRGIKKFAGAEKPCCHKPASSPVVDEETLRALIEEELALLPVEQCVCEEGMPCECYRDEQPCECVKPQPTVVATPVEQSPIEIPAEEEAEEENTEVIEQPVIAAAPTAEKETLVEDNEKEEDENQEETPFDPTLPESLIGIAGKGKRKKPPFETRVKNSDFDIRHKYYDLRDYLTWYGFKNRLSNPGDTFSYQRQRYAFITIVGKHIRLYIGLNPDDYVGSTVPVEKIEAKKYEDVPCMLRIRSDLSYRRAKKLVDDLAAKIGLPMPEGEPPKETQEVK